MGTGFMNAQIGIRLRIAGSTTSRVFFRTEPDPHDPPVLN